jgi:hypothetical protein
MYPFWKQDMEKTKNIGFAHNLVLQKQDWTAVVPDLSIGDLKFHKLNS